MIMQLQNLEQLNGVGFMVHVLFNEVEENCLLLGGVRGVGGRLR